MIIMNKDYFIGKRVITTLLVFCFLGLFLISYFINFQEVYRDSSDWFGFLFIYPIPIDINSELQIIGNSFIFTSLLLNLLIYYIVSVIISILVLKIKKS